ncbi:MAG: MFS transporter [Deltaproteobacteria bacterium]|jgi:MFS family permease|nr:MFS transporter [Deltaproteobacteria bacterium]
MPSQEQTIPKHGAVPQAPLKTRLWTRTFFTILFVNFAVFLGFNMLLPTLSLFLHGRGLSEREIGLVFGSFTVSAITFRLLANTLSKRFGTMTVVRLGFVTCGLGAAGFIVADNMGLYFLARLMQGAGFAVSSTLLVSVAANIIPPGRLGEGVGYVGLGATLSLALGPVLGLWLADSHGFTVMLLFSGLACVVAAVISLMLPRISIPQGGPKDKGPWLEKSALAPAALSFVYGAGVSAMTVYLAIYCEQQGLPSAASFFMVSTVGTVVARLTTGRIYDRKGHFFVIPPAVAMLVASIMAIIVVPPTWVMYVAAVIYGLGAGAIFPSIQTLSLSSVPPERRTVGSAYFFVAFDSGIGLGTVLLGFVAGFYHSYRSVFEGSIAIFFVLLLCYLTLFAKKPKAAGD